MRKNYRPTPRCYGHKPEPFGENERASPFPNIFVDSFTFQLRPDRIEALIWALADFQNRPTDPPAALGVNLNL